MTSMTTPGSTEVPSRALPPVCYAVIFTSRRTGRDNEEYEKMSQKMVALSSRQKGFLKIESVRDNQGNGITISYWETLADIAAWRDNSEHRFAQELGRSKWYESFHIQIAKIDLRGTGTTPIQRAWACEPMQLTGPRVQIRTLEDAHISKVALAIQDPQGFFGQVWGIDTVEKTEQMLGRQLVSHAGGLANPLVYFVNGEVAGITRLMRIDEAAKTLEIGGTWVAPKWRRSYVNTEVKYLLLEHCFEKLGCVRVEFRVNVANLTSQKAVLRIGATLEGTLRHRQIYQDGSVADGLLFSMIEPEWTDRKQKLQTLMKT